MCGSGFHDPLKRILDLLPYLNLNPSPWISYPRKREIRKAENSSVVDPDLLLSVWRIRDVYPGSDFFRIPDPNCLRPGFKYFKPKKQIKLFLSSKKYDPDPDADFLPSRIQGSKRHPIPEPGSGSATLSLFVPVLRIHASVSWIRIRIQLFSSLTFKMPTKT